MASKPSPAFAKPSSRSAGRKPTSRSSARVPSLPRKPICWTKLPPRSESNFMRFVFWLLPSLLTAQSYDIVLQSGRVMDPESGLDAVRSVGITGNKIAAVSASPLRGKIEVDARNLVIAPGFIDLHQHSQTPDA